MLIFGIKKTFVLNEKAGIKNSEEIFFCLISFSDLPPFFE